MKAALRVIVAVFAGLLVSFVFVIAVELFGAAAHPVPEDFQGTSEEVCQHVERCPQWVLAVVVPAWAVTAFAGTRTAQRIGKLSSAVIVALLILASLVFNISILPYPLWFKIANLIVIPTALVAGIRPSLSRQTARTGEAN